MMYPGAEIAEMNLLASDEDNRERLVEAVNAQAGRDQRASMVFCDKAPKALGIQQNVSHCKLAVPQKSERFLLPLFAYIPGAILASYRAAVIKEPYFRGGAFTQAMTLSSNPVVIV